MHKFFMAKIPVGIHDSFGGPGSLFGVDFSWLNVFLGDIDSRIRGIKCTRKSHHDCF